MKHLTITYNDTVLFDGEIAELIWSDNANGVKVEGRITKAANGPGLLDMLTSSLTAASKAKTQDLQEQLTEGDDQ